MKSELLLKVAVPSPLRRSFDYLLTIPVAGPKPQPGMRVRVPFGRREVIGLITGSGGSSELAHAKLKPVLALLDDSPILDQHTLALYLWASDYYQFPVGQVLQSSLPKAVREGRALVQNLPERWQVSGTGANTSHRDLQRSPRQQAVLELIRHHGSLSTAEISRFTGTAAGSFIKALRDKALIVRAPQEPAHTSQGKTGTRNAPQTLNREQATVLQEINRHLHHYQCLLLEGITGSGKTEVYLQVIAQVLDSGRQVLVLVPEISLTPQTIARFRQRFTGNIVILHSGLSDNERLDAWLQARDGSADIVIGTRSAIFTPLARLGLIIVDEEHDSSYKQQEGFRYSARDLAIYRARQQNIAVLLGSATPSLETLSKALAGRYRHLQLHERAGAASVPLISFIDLRGERLEQGFSPLLMDEIRHHLEQGQQVLIFINRRGFAPILQCHDCGWIALCSRCETSYTLHQHPPGLRCHHCDAQLALPKVCPKCRQARLFALGLGTERSETVLKSCFPDTPIIRVDRDSTRKKSAMGAIIDEVNQGHSCILIGTQMLAKGHHFPRVTLVAILDADSGLFSPDFRGQEHMGQLLTQVAGRSGRGDSPGQVLIQTHHSTHPGLNMLINEGYGSFARQLLEERRRAQLPPFSHLVLFRAEAANRATPQAFLHALHQQAETLGRARLEILGPMPAPMEKRAGRFRYQLFIKAQTRSRLHQLLRPLVSSMDQHPLARKVRWSVDVDPVDLG
ncbi:MAG: primosomal protein N' [Pseudomonadales bacterium]|nr:primosomal protein N' [Pseudomonadales bacterium]